MGIGTLQGIPKITIEIMNLELLISKLKWYQIIRKIKYHNKLTELRRIGFRVGLEMAFDDLEKAGILTRINK